MDGIGKNILTKQNTKNFALNTFGRLILPKVQMFNLTQLDYGIYKRNERNFHRVVR